MEIQGWEYEQIDGWPSMNLEEAVNLLKQYDAEGKHVCMEFNGTMLYSDTVTIDDAYLKVCGKTRDEVIKARKEWLERVEKEKAEHKAKIPELTKKWIESGHAILDEKYWDKWDECVPVRLDDIYQGMELGNCLDIVAVLNNGASMEVAEKVIKSQDHSGMSYNLVRCMVACFCDRGKEFFEFTKN